LEPDKPILVEKTRKQWKKIQASGCLTLIAVVVGLFVAAKLFAWWDSG
jgi:hypothetical protein